MDGHAVLGSGLQRMAAAETAQCLHLAARLSSNYANAAQKQRGIIYDSTGSLDVNLVNQNLKGKCPPAHPQLKVEKIDGGLMVAGVIVLNSCQVVLPAFGCLFLIVGTVLTVTSYRGPEAGEKAQHYASRIEFSRNSRTLGPICLAVAVLMIICGTALCLLSKRARLKQERVGFHCPLHGDFFPNEHAEDNFFTRSKTVKWWCGEQHDDDDDDGDFDERLPPQCPHSIVSSQRSSISSSLACPAPLPIVVTSNSLNGFSNGPGPAAHVPSDLIFGSIRSLSVSHDVASFPASRSPSPTSSSRIVSPSPVNLMEDTDRIGVYSLMTSPMVESITPEIKLVAPAPQALSSGDSETAPRRKSVTIVLPSGKMF